MKLVLIIAWLVLLPFAAVLLTGAPYLPTRRKTAEAALELLQLETGDLLVDLGCGDGSVMIAAAQKGIRSVGYELNPFIFAVAWLRIRRYHKLASVKPGNFWRHQLPADTKGVFTFLHNRFMKRLDAYLTKEAKRLGRKIPLISYTFQIPDRNPTKEKTALYLYWY